MPHMTKTMLEQLAYCASLQGGDPIAGQGNGDFNRYSRMHKAGFVTITNGRFVVTDAGHTELTRHTFKRLQSGRKVLITKGV